MSHISRIKTQMVEQEYLLQALQDTGYSYNVVKNFLGRGAGIKINVSLPPRHTVSFWKTGEAYDCVGNWDSIRTNRQEFLQQITQRYAYHAALAKLEQQGFSVVSEDVQEGNRIHLRLRRMA